MSDETTPAIDVPFLAAVSIEPIGDSNLGPVILLRLYGDSAGKDVEIAKYVISLELANALADRLLDAAFGLRVELETEQEQELEIERSEDATEAGQ